MISSAAIDPLTVEIVWPHQGQTGWVTNLCKEVQGLLRLPQFTVIPSLYEFLCDTDELKLH